MLEIGRYCSCVKGIFFFGVGDHRQISITLLLPKIFEKIVAWKLSHFWRVTVCFLRLSFLIVRGWEHVILCSHCIIIYKLLWTGTRREVFFQLDFSTALDRDSDCGMLYNLRSIGVGGQFLFTISEFLSDSRCVWMVRSVR